MRVMGNLRWTAALTALLWCAPSLAQTGAPPSLDNRGDSAEALRRRGTRWADSQLQVGLSANVDFFDSSYRAGSRSLAALDLSLALRPRFRVSDTLQLRFAWSVALELTDSEVTRTQREPVVDDPSLELWFLGTPPVGALRFSFGAGVVAPVSDASRALTTILTLTAAARASWGADLAAGRFTAVATLGYAHVFSDYTTPGVRGSIPYARLTVGGGDSGQLRGSTNVHDELAWRVTVTQTWGRWSPGASFGMWHQWAYGVSAPGSSSVGVDGSGTRDYSNFTAWLDLSASSWLTFELGYTLSRALKDADGTLGNPFYSTSHDWRVYLVANFELDRLVEAAQGRGEGLGRILRASASTRRAP